MFDSSQYSKWILPLNYIKYDLKYFTSLKYNKYNIDNIYFGMYMSFYFNKSFKSFGVLMDYLNQKIDRDTHNSNNKEYMLVHEYINTSYDHNNFNIYILPLEIWGKIFNFLTYIQSKLISLLSSYLYDAYKYSNNQNRFKKIEHYSKNVEHILSGKLLRYLPIVYTNKGDIRNFIFQKVRQITEVYSEIPSYYDLIEGVVLKSDELLEINGFIFCIGHIEIKYINNMIPTVKIAKNTNLYKIHFFDKPFFRYIHWLPCYIYKLDYKNDILLDCRDEFQYKILAAFIHNVEHYNHIKQLNMIKYILANEHIFYIDHFCIYNETNIRKYSVNFSDVCEIIDPII